MPHPRSLPLPKADPSPPRHSSRSAFGCLCAAKALDHLLAALSNPLDGKLVDDVAEAAAEAFDRELMYLSAVYDIFRRTYQAMINPALDQNKARGSLDSRAFVEKEVAHSVRRFATR